MFECVQTSWTRCHIDGVVVTPSRAGQQYYFVAIAVARGKIISG